MTGYALIAPEVIVLAGVAWAMFAEMLPGRDRGAAWVGAILMALAGVVAGLQPLGGELFGGMIAFDGTARFARIGIALLAVIWLVWTGSRAEGRIREAVALALLAAIGGMLMAEARELVTLVLAIELATMPAYVLIGYRTRRADGLEGALKYFLLSMLTSLVMIYGMSFLYGVTGTTRFAALDLTGSGTMGVLAVVLTFVGLFAKLSAVPFHYWAPDAYEGSEPWTVAFVSTVPKVAGAIAVVRLTAALAPTAPGLGLALVAVSGASIVFGNFAALNQTDVRRMMAYSGVAHTGYLLLGAGALTAAGLGAATFYAIAYAVPSLGIMLVAAEAGSRLTDFSGLSTHRPALAWSTVLMLISLIGIPPFVGFMGKLYLFGAALRAGLAGWVIAAVIMSVVSAAYYLRIVRSMFFGEANDGLAFGHRTAWGDAAIITAAAITLALGIAAGPLLAALGTPIP